MSSLNQMYVSGFSNIIEDFIFKIDHNIILKKKKKKKKEIRMISWLSVHIEFFSLKFDIIKHVHKLNAETRSFKSSQNSR